ncbi:MAG: NAD-dependent epimerase/dehydratase family protein [Woeseia sp.]|jgi:2'-hydroxyisoflavone reductase|nr:NAD-dependent epimerase/dehydratase family protein [Woeseia sp.]MBT6209872.1 NAD-dependent epimerase/dehydratase family protein [Woeseia sp.]
MNTRREFMTASAGIAALGLLGSEQSSGQSSGGLNILVLGGTGFIGPHFVRHALARGHKITLFNRGRTNTHLFPEAEKLVGDRNDNLRSLEGRRWDAVLDNSGYTPLQVRQSVDLLKNSCEQYLFTSTRAVYTDFIPAVMDEDAPVGPKGIPESEWSGYGPNKVLAERIVQEGFGARTLITRPPVIVGPGDRTDRFTYWVDRLDEGGEVLVQGHHADPIQFVEVRDLSEFYVHLLENSTTGIYNTEGPQAELDTAGLVHGIRAITSTPSNLNWVPWDFLVQQGEVPQDTVVFWNRPSGRYLNYGRMVNARAIDKGMKFRPLATIAQDTLAWHRTRPAESQATLRAGLTRDREQELLRLYRDQ